MLALWYVARVSASTDKPRKKQMNVRISEDVIDQADARRARLGLSRDAWVERALRYALRAPLEVRTDTARTVRSSRR